jgi:signal recognition particle GTPase
MCLLSSIKTRKICVVMFVGLEGVGKSFLAGKYIDFNMIQSFKLAHM